MLNRKVLKNKFQIIYSLDSDQWLQSSHLFLRRSQKMVSLIWRVISLQV